MNEKIINIKVEEQEVAVNITLTFLEDGTFKASIVYPDEVPPVDNKATKIATYIFDKLVN